MRALGKLIQVETKLLTRDLGAVFFGVLFPAILLVGLGAIPGFREIDPDVGPGGLRGIDVYLPIVLVLALALTGMMTVPASLAAYRHQGVLRRLRTTPVGPAPLLAAQLVANVLAATVALALTVATALLVYGVPAPASWPGAVVALLLASWSLFSVGLIIAALAPSATAAPAIGTFVWLPLMVLGGLWFPREQMPDTMRTISDLSPTGAAVDAVQHAWFDGAPPASSLLVLAGSAVLVGLVAAVTFRWE